MTIEGEVVRKYLPEPESKVKANIEDEIKVDDLIFADELLQDIFLGRVYDNLHRRIE